MNERNQAYWNRTSDEYQALHGAELTKTAFAWGVWRIPESALQFLGDVKNCQRASPTYFVPEAWARRWPADHIWKLTKA